MRKSDPDMKFAPSDSSVETGRLKMTFDNWITFIFDRPVTNREWYWDIEVEWPELDAPSVVAYLTQVFECAGSVLRPFSDAQANQGLHLLIGPGSDYMLTLQEPTVSHSERLRCIRAMAVLFEKCFSLRCSQHLSHLDEPGANPLNGVCYMWWDILPIHGLIHDQTGHSDSAEIVRACLSVMNKTLEIASVACQESALHGLGHWSSIYPDAKAIIDDFLERNDNIPPKLRSYAKAARQGAVQ